MQLDENTLDFEKCGGLLPVVVQDFADKDVLMLAYANYEALQKTVESGYAHYYSRSRAELWKKGESSGHLQIIKDILFDCDNDTLIYVVDQKGGVSCHTGRKTCFFNRIDKNGVHLKIN